ncbi:unnamed protein product [Protopolystoma xenopodis]|uniref:Amino acid permease/ SLC12A domain-containing protein n=1 Tax=Protopolystoma xenopodis TaxID=117903 RepID=A0A448XH06_9PLAT|nr:unnamed protein product [Protopolystoma xenopodis]
MQFWPLLYSFSTTLSSQCYWQASASTKADRAIYGFQLGAMIWFGVPFCFGTACGLAYLALGLANGGDLLSQADVSAGLVPVVVAWNLFGRIGVILLVLLCLMAITITGSSQIMAMTSIIILDIYAIYVKVRRHAIIRYIEYMLMFVHIYIYICVCVDEWVGGLGIAEFI